MHLVSKPKYKGGYICKHHKYLPFKLLYKTVDSPSSQGVLDGEFPMYRKMVCMIDKQEERQIFNINC